MTPEQEEWTKRYYRRRAAWSLYEQHRAEALRAWIIRLSCWAMFLTILAAFAWRQHG